MAKPTKYPEWASQDVVDGISGVNNVVEPSEAKKDLGHGPLGEFPPRQYQNWFMRLVYQWIVWFDSEDNQSGTFSCKVLNTEFSSQHIFDIDWVLKSGIVSIRFPGLSQTSISTAMNIHPNGAASFPAAIIPVAAINKTFIVFDSSASYARVGRIELDPVGTNPWTLAWAEDDGDLNNSGFTGSGNKGWQLQSITYPVI
ncbi:hypothetical protein KAR91_48675 [Candidatus Pacearchaeota archaeon]|nr:hypothetical protein [Candidatus Pacearchaeota archaeon]